MVKRIRKRVQKTDTTGNEDANGEEREDGAPLSFGEQLDAMSGDGVTTAIAGWVKSIEANKGIVSVAAVLLVGAFVGMYMMQANRDEGAGVAAASFNTGAEAFAKVVAPKSDDPKTPPAKLEGKARTVQLDKAQKAFSTTQSTYGTSPIATLAALGEAGAQLELGKTDAALKLYGQVTSAGGAEVFVKALAIQGQAVAYERKGDAKAALKAWQALEGVDKAAFGLLAGMQQGRLLESSGDSAGALALYTKLKASHTKDLNKFSYRETKSQIDRRLARLGSAKTSKK